MNKNIIFFDSECNLCNGFISFIITFDKYNQFYFASLDGPTAKELKVKTPDQSEFQTVIFVDKFGKFFERSDAVIEIFSRLFWPKRAFLVFKLIPRFIRDFIYKIIAKNRYIIFWEEIFL